MDALTIPVEGCSRFPPILYDYPNPYCILASAHPRMEYCCAHVAGSKKNTAEGCYPWCAILPQTAAAAAAASSNGTAPTTDDTITSFYKCLLDGDDGAAPEGMSCSTALQRREESAASPVAEAAWFRIKVASGLGALMVAALLSS